MASQDGVSGRSHVLTANPEKSHFVQSYKRYTPFRLDTNTFAFAGTPSTGSTVTLELQAVGDVVTGFAVQLVIPEITVTAGATDTAFTTNLEFSDWLGYAAISSIEMYIGQSKIDTIMGRWMTIWAAMTNPRCELNSLREMVDYDITSTSPLSPGYRQSITWDASGAITAVSNPNYSNESVVGQSSYTIPSRTVTVPIPFWFTERTELALPMIALQQSPVRFNVALANLSELCSFTIDPVADGKTAAASLSMGGTTVTTVTVAAATPAATEPTVASFAQDLAYTNVFAVVDFAYLGQMERWMLTDKPIDQVITTHQATSELPVPPNGQTIIPLVLHGMPRSVYWTIQRSEYCTGRFQAPLRNTFWTNMDNANTLSSASTVLDTYHSGGGRRFHMATNMSFEHRGSGPSTFRTPEEYGLAHFARDYHGTPPVGVYGQNFCINPMDPVQPSGILDLSVITHVGLRVNTRSTAGSYVLRGYARGHAVLHIERGHGGLVLGL